MQTFEVANKYAHFSLFLSKKVYICMLIQQTFTLIEPKQINL